MRHLLSSPYFNDSAAARSQNGSRPFIPAQVLFFPHTAVALRSSHSLSIKVVYIKVRCGSMCRIYAITNGKKWLGYPLAFLLAAEILQFSTLSRFGWAHESSSAVFSFTYHPQWHSYRRKTSMHSSFAFRKCGQLVYIFSMSRRLFSVRPHPHTFIIIIT